jgi:hypothetical protein
MSAPAQQTSTTAHGTDEGGDAARAQLLSATERKDLATVFAAEAASKIDQGLHMAPHSMNAATSPLDSPATTPPACEGILGPADVLQVNPEPKMTLGLRETTEKKKKGLRSPKQSPKQEEAAEWSETPDAKARLPSPTLLSIRKLLRRQTPAKQHVSEEEPHACADENTDDEHSSETHYAEGTQL